MDMKVPPIPNHLASVRLLGNPQHRPTFGFKRNGHASWFDSSSWFNCDEAKFLAFLSPDETYRGVEIATIEPLP